MNQSFGITSFYRTLLTVVVSSSFLLHRTKSFLLPKPASLQMARKHAARSQLFTKFLNQVEETIVKVQSIPSNTMDNLQNLPPSRRESVGVTNRLSQRIHSLHKNNDCPACWLQRAHCICPSTPPIEHLLPSNIQRIFMIMHHKEIGLVVDTAKLLLNAFPDRMRLVVSGVSEEYQNSVKELMDALEQKERKCIVLFPTDDAVPFHEMYQKAINKNDFCKNDIKDDHASEGMNDNVEYDIVVMDGTWQQARKIHGRYIPLEKNGGPQRVCLSQESLDILGSAADNPEYAESHFVHGIEKGGNGRQLRRHPIKWKEVSTLEATRLLFRDMMVAMDVSDTEEYKDQHGNQCHDLLARYQRISDEAAVRQLGPPRERAKAI